MELQIYQAQKQIAPQMHIYQLPPSTYLQAPWTKSYKSHALHSDIGLRSLMPRILNFRNENNTCIINRLRKSPLLNPKMLIKSWTESIRPQSFIWLHLKNCFPKFIYCKRTNQSGIIFMSYFGCHLLNNRIKNTLTAQKKIYKIIKYQSTNALLL